MVDGYRIDRASQKILLRLNADSWTIGRTLREAAELSQNGQVFYRMEEHLIPIGFVIEQPRSGSGTGRGYHNRRRFRLTPSGAEWLEEHEDEVARPASRTETQQMAYEALDTAKSAKESVQSYRKKIHRIRQHVDGVNETVEDAAQKFRTAERVAKSANVDAHEAKSRSRKASNAVSKMDDRLQVVERDQQQSKMSFESRIDAQEAGVRDLRDEVEQLRSENARLRSEVRELRERMDQRLVVRIRRWLKDVLEWLGEVYRIVLRSLREQKG